MDKFGSLSIIAHMILMLPHPFKFQQQQQHHHHHHHHHQLPQKPSSISTTTIKRFLLYRPLEGFSDWISPTSKVYRGITPQFKIFLQIAFMTLGGCIWAEKRYNEYIDLVRRIKRAERERSRW